MLKEHAKMVEDEDLKELDSPTDARNKRELDQEEEEENQQN